MGKQSNASKISTPKKIALTVLGALAVLTFVNLIEAAVNKYKGEEAIIVHEVEDSRYRSEDKVKKKIKTGAGELMIERSFDVSEGENLSVKVGDADIIVTTERKDEARVEIYLDGKNMEKAREYFEDQRFEVTRSDGTIYVVTHPQRNNYSWNRMGSPQITVEVAIPDAFNVELKTSDGDVIMEPLHGEVNIHTSDGDIATGSVSGSAYIVRTSDGDILAEAIEVDEANLTTSDGDITTKDILANDINIRTSDGDIRTERLEGSAAVSTSDGDLYLSSFSGRELALRTSDGEIVAERIDAGESQVHTSDGNITLKQVAGSLNAKTSSGDLTVNLEEAGDEVYLTSGDGDILLTAPDNTAAELFLKGERVRLSSSFRFDGVLKKNEAEGLINGGGAQIQARTSDGEVIFREN